MRDGSVIKSLGANVQPKGTFTLTRVKSASADVLAPNVPVNIVAEGTFSLHGITKTIAVPATLTYVPSSGPFSTMRPGNFVRMTATFDIKLADYNVDSQRSGVDAAGRRDRARDDQRSRQRCDTRRSGNLPAEGDQVSRQGTRRPVGSSRASRPANRRPRPSGKSDRRDCANPMRRTCMRGAPG